MKTAALKFLGVVALIILVFWAVAKVQNEGDQRARAEVGQDQRDNAAAIQKRHVLIGMSATQVRQAWGEPARVVRTTTERGEYEEWSYGSSTVLVLVNGVLKSGTRADGK